MQIIQLTVVIKICFPLIFVAWNMRLCAFFFGLDLSNPEKHEIDPVIFFTVTEYTISQLEYTLFLNYPSFFPSNIQVRVQHMALSK